MARQGQAPKQALNSSTPTQEPTPSTQDRSPLNALPPVILLLLLLPTTSWASTDGLTSALSVGSTWGMKTLGLARGLFPAVLILSLAVALVFKPASPSASVRSTVWRALLVFVLLVKLPVPATGARGQSTTVYGWSCFLLAGLSDSIAETLAPTDVWTRFAEVNAGWQKELLAGAKEQGGGLDAAAGFIGAEVGGALFGTLIAFALAVGQAAMWVMQELAKVLAILLYVVGPLALVFWVPFSSDSLSRWLKTFVSILTWPVLSALMLDVIVSAGLKGLQGASPAFASISTALLLSVCACAVPMVASSLVGGSLGAIGAGLNTMTLGGSAAVTGATLASTAATAGAGAVSAGAASAASGAASGLGRVRDHYESNLRPTQPIRVPPGSLAPSSPTDP